MIFHFSIPPGAVVMGGAFHVSVAKSVLAAESKTVVIWRSCAAVTGRMQVRVLPLAQNFERPKWALFLIQIYP